MGRSSSSPVLSRASVMQMICSGPRAARFFGLPFELTLFGLECCIGIGRPRSFLSGLEAVPDGSKSLKRAGLGERNDLEGLGQRKSSLSEEERGRPGEGRLASSRSNFSTVSLREGTDRVGTISAGGRRTRSEKGSLVLERTMA